MWDYRDLSVIIYAWPVIDTGVTKEFSLIIDTWITKDFSLIIDEWETKTSH